MLTFAILSAASAGLPVCEERNILALLCDVDKSVDFLVDAMGCETSYSFGPFKDDGMTKNLNVNPRAAVKIITMVRCGNGPSFEVFQYTWQDQNPTLPKNRNGCTLCHPGVCKWNS